MSTLNKSIYHICKERFEKMLENGAFPEIEYRVTPDKKMTSYNLLEYTQTWARFMKVVDDWVREKHDSALGVFTRKRNQKMLDEIKSFVEAITEQDVRNHPTRFGTFMD